MKAAIDLLQGNIPPTVDHPELYRQRSGGVMLPRSADWVEATEAAGSSHRPSVPTPRAGAAGVILSRHSGSNDIRDLIHP